ncbi:hypothetical protein BDM02DRAFT_533181 [Thelephora ganbajun]|uniref:Uncharacterized protein n=1 Tax=Thelephora ganbajun TaxID=370292 RepID=A0ACB6ZQJ2_THEGA|nr:hypothetical protein BDM02DRAFT_533181 [Thelephora ganbajun]
MRIRVSTVPPLSLTKHSLCKQIPALKGLRGDQIRLFVDDFELLDTLPIDVVRENDLVHVKWIDSRTATSVLRKRKRADPTTSSLLSLSSSASSSEPSSDSSPDSESTTDSSSDSDSPPSEPKAVKRNERQPPNKRPFVPPGMGKSATHSRNIRRRRKLHHERDAAIRDPDDPTVGVNAIPIGKDNSTEVPEATAPTIVGSHGDFADITMASLSNKNKRRGFKNAMRKEVPPKIIFPEQVNPNTNLNGAVQAPALRLVPPSEKQENGLLPPNIFVTSIDVEEGLRPSKKQKPVISDTERSEKLSAARSASEIDRTAIQAKWNSFGLVSSVTRLPTGTLVGWKVSPGLSFA